MNWHKKARLQRSIASLPNAVSYPLYYQMQRWAGAMRDARLDPTSRLLAGFETCKLLLDKGLTPVGVHFFEVGTGWRLNLPIACWLCGADRITTVDLNPYLKPDLVWRDIKVIQTRRKALENKLAEYNGLLQQDRWEELQSLSPTSTTKLLKTLQIDYLAPADAGSIDLPDDTIDFHVSNNTLEHIPGEVLRRIFTEATRITKATGALLHRVDHSDHFSHSDRAISRINFLRFSNSEWARLADNRYAYVNRLREADYLALFRSLGYEVSLCQSEHDDTVAVDLSNGFPLDDRFSRYDADELAVLASQFILNPPSLAASLSA